MVPSVKLAKLKKNGSSRRPPGYAERMAASTCDHDWKQGGRLVNDAWDICSKCHEKKMIDIQRRLDLGSGPNGKPGFIHVDQTAFPGVDVVHDLTKPWPWETSSVEEVHSSHCLEHFDAMERVHFLNELYRVLKPGAKATIICPHWASCRAYGDPTHKWPPVSEFAFFYWKKDWRMANAPHTDASNLKGGFNTNFEVTWGYSLEPGVAMKNQEYQQYAMQYLTEARQDVIATLTAIK